MNEDRPPVTEEELDEAAAALIPGLMRASDRALEEPHDFGAAHTRKPTPKPGIRYGIRSDALGLTDTLDVRITHEFAPRWCALGDDARAKVDPVIAILELYPGTAGRVELYLCAPHHANLLDTYRRRALEANTTELHFAGRRIIALNPRPLDVQDVIKSGGATHENPPPPS